MSTSYISEQPATASHGLGQAEVNALERHGLTNFVKLCPCVTRERTVRFTVGLLLFGSNTNMKLA